MKQRRRNRIHEATRQEIKETAWQQIAEQGAPALSLRQIARAMDLSAPALYRYYPSRDDLVTALIQDAFTSFATALAAARDSRPIGDHAGRYAAMGLAYRQWALQYPQRYALIFGTPIPGYVYPPSEPNDAADSAFKVLLGVLLDAARAGILQPIAEYRDLSPTIHSGFDSFRAFIPAEIPDVVVYLSLITLARVHGMVSLELNKQFPPEYPLGSLYEQELIALGNQVGLPYPAAHESP